MLNVIIGAGPAGLGAAYACQKNNENYLILEKRAQIGGHSGSFHEDGTTFDEGPHISFTKFPKLRALFDANADWDVREDVAVVSNYYESKWVTHPIMANLKDLGDFEGWAVYKSFTETKTSSIDPKNYQDWLIKTYGNEAYNSFFEPYTLKYWGVHSSKMSIDWVKGRFFAPSPSVVLEGLTRENRHAHYVSKFYYPRNGGFQRFFENFVSPSSCKVNCEVIAIDLEKKVVQLHDESKINFDNLISTIPLPELINILGHQVPSEVMQSAAKLSCTSVHLINIKVSKYDGPKVHWFYVYDLKLYSTRVTIQTAIEQGLDYLDREVAIQVEVYEREDMKISNEVEQIVVNELSKMGLFSIENLIFSSQTFIKYANVLFDLERKQNLEVIVKYLESIKIQSVGRFGSWDYLWSDESFLQGVNSIDPNIDNALREE